MYLYHILSRDPRELVRKVYEAQRLKTVTKDWFEMICQEKIKYDICLSDQEIRCMSKSKFKEIVNKKVNCYAFSKLKEKAESQSKCQQIVKQINVNNMITQKYLLTNDLVKEEQILLFSLRCKSFPVKSNFQYMYKDDMSCRACLRSDTIESEKHFS